MIDKTQFREMVVEVLQYLEPEISYSNEAVELLVLTAAHESRMGTYVRQVRGPARGVMQMEPATHNDLWHNFLAYKKDLADKIKRLTFANDTGLDNLKGNLYYQIAMARVHYFRIKAGLPKIMNFPNRGEWEHGLAKYWKKYYNTHLGKGEVTVALSDYRRYGK